MNYPELRHLIEKLSFDLMDARLEHIADGENKLQFTFKKYGDEDTRARFFLVIDFLPSHLDIYPTTRPKKAPPVPQAFTMLLRKYIGNTMLTGLRIADDDRIVTFEFGFDNAPFFEFIAELTGRSPHIFLIESESRKILGMIGQDDTRKIHGIYTPPEPPARKSDTDRFDSLDREDLYTALDGEFAARDEKERIDFHRNQALKRIRKTLARANKLYENLSKELMRADNAERERAEADLLNAYAYKLKQGMIYAELPDFETGEPMRITLDPAISIRENIEKRYAHSKRMTRSREQVKARLDQTFQKRAALEDLEKTVLNAKDSSQILELGTQIDELCGTDGKPAPAQPKKPKVTVHKPYKTFKSADGTLILVGKSAKDNDDLTFHHTRGNDYWLHVSGIPGSHIVIKSAEPSQETILDAALLAMHYSKRSKSEAAEVHLTQVKYVRKPKGAPDGKVEIRGEKAIIARASQKRLERLMQTES
ncbi:MAG: DUF814 domain-containing protein [Proteobacteria bacterium]|nr:DUF814 domain-containing protein [Pseudomonadota bacterium]